eukprot:7359120-Pyramimonas_sp.AAC.1
MPSGPLPGSIPLVALQPRRWRGSRTARTRRRPKVAGQEEGFRWEGQRGNSRGGRKHAGLGRPD